MESVNAPTPRISAADEAALNIIARHGSLTPAALAEELGLAAHAGPFIANRLTAKGHAAWGINPKDRRGLVISLAPRTRKLLGPVA